MSHEHDLLELLASDVVRVLAFHPLGTEVVPIPSRFLGQAASPLDMELHSPLDAFSPEFQGQAVVAYEGARRMGHGSAPIEVLGETTSLRLEIFNMEETDGCFIGVLVPAELTSKAEPVSFAPRQGSFEVTAGGEILVVSPAFLQMFGWDESEVLGQSALDFIHPDDHEAGILNWVAVLESPRVPCTSRQRFKHKDGNWTWCEVTDTNYLNDPDREHVLGEVVNISSEMEAQQALQRRETVLNRLRQALPTGILHLDENGDSAVWNDRWSELTGVDGSVGVDGLAGCVEDEAALRSALADSIERSADNDLDVVLTGTGGCRFGELHIRPLEENGTPFGLLLTLDDVTRSRTHAMELARQARQDPLTKLLNRFGIEEVLERHLGVDGAKGEDCSVLFLDLDRFKQINDRFGHQVGDRVLCEVAATIGGLLRSDDAFGRLGGDEFLAVLSGSWSDDDVAKLAERVEAGTDLGDLAALADGIDVGITVGIAKSEPGDDMDAILKRADQAMYANKRRRTDDTPVA